jgi:23S rRNA pseudouridine1911/1915/1917 synthase
MLREGLTSRVRRALVMSRHALHCAGLGFDHPMTGERILVEAPLPRDMEAFIGEIAL